jgi:hypothetical protein
VWISTYTGQGWCRSAYDTGIHKKEERERERKDRKKKDIEKEKNKN